MIGTLFWSDRKSGRANVSRRAWAMGKQTQTVTATVDLFVGVSQGVAFQRFER